MKYKIIVPENLLHDISKECDKYPNLETGGRLVGKVHYNRYSVTINIEQLIDAGENAKRTAGSLFQDSNYQARIFSSLASKDRLIEYLGSWHSHHCNGLDTLSGGDEQTYHNIANHQKHNLNFFLAMLVVQGANGNKYDCKFFIFTRNNSDYFEVKNSDILVIRKVPTRVITQDYQIIKEMFPHFNLFQKNGQFIWQGELSLPNSKCNVKVISGSKYDQWSVVSNKSRVINAPKFDSAFKALFSFYIQLLMIHKKPNRILQIFKRQFRKR